MNMLNFACALNCVILLVIRTVVTGTQTMSWKYLTLRYKSVVLRNSRESQNDLNQPGSQPKRKLPQYVVCTLTFISVFV